MDQLLNGYRRFRRDRWPERRRTYEILADAGQQPRALVLSCADSRVDPAAIFDAGPGELFVVRNVANLVPPYAPDGAWHGTSAAVEFAIRILEVPDILVMGHGLCGGVRSLLEDAPGGVPGDAPGRATAEASDFIAPWIALAAPAKVRALARTGTGDLQLRCELETIKLSLENLSTFPWIAARIAAGTLRMSGAHFDVRSGELSILGDGGEFQTVPPV
jgi:carbonic anhydrase